jgi:predicted enzyme related to lactoylglutathione lyase
VWHEHNSSDATAAKDFYANLLGWEFEVMKGEGFEYPMVLANGVTHGGFGGAQGGAPPHWLGYVQVEDADATAEKIKSAGGTVVSEQDMPEIGKFVIFTDPQGATVAAFQPAGDSPAREGVFIWDELHTTDLADAKRFYNEVFGWTAKPMTGDFGEYTIFERPGGGDMGLGGASDQGTEHGSYWLHYIHVDDVDATAAKAQELGSNAIMEPMDIPTIGRMAILTDPTGAVFALFKPDPNM